MLHRPSARFVASSALAVMIAAATAAAGQPAPRSAEAPAQPQAPAPQVVVSDQDARETRNDFEGVLRRLPPSVGRVMRIDPSLMRNPAYLAPYPALSSFLQAHPEVAQNPGYYLEHIDYEFWNPRQPDDPRSQSIRMWRDAMQGFAIMIFLGTVTFVLIWIIRTLVEYRRWYRTSKVQTEVHTKLLDRFTSNEDLLAYMQTSPGKRFLESAPVPSVGAEKPIAAPLGRILWSLQAGVVLAVASVGLLVVSQRVIEEVSQPLFALGVLVLALGIGFIVSAAASFLLSRRLGLLQPITPPHEHAGPSGA